jgi:16S rRNA (guanine527-N7)-methyltransferase
MLDFSTRYLQILNTKLKGLNLTKILDPDEFYNKQILDSIYPYQQSDFFKQQVEKYRIVVDVGFGGGFPILPLAHLLPHIQFIGVETRRKKVDAVKLLAGELGLKNVKLIHSRLEDFFIDKESVITFKAVGTIGNYLPIIHHSKNVSVFFYKGPSFYELESKDLEAVKKDWLLHPVSELDVPNTEKRILVPFTNQNVPRGTPKSLVKLTDFL